MSGLTVTWNGTCNLRLEWEGTVIFFDPWFSRNEESEPAISAGIDFVDDGAAIFITHGHFDHLQDVPAILRSRKVDVYCSGVARQTIERELVKEDVVGDQLEELLSRVHVIQGGDTVSLGEGRVMVEAIKSTHGVFDARSILRAFLNWKTLRSLGKLTRILRAYPKGPVLGYSLTLARMDRNRGERKKEEEEKGEGTSEIARLVLYGSMSTKYPDLMARFEGADIFFAPVAGRFNSDEVTLEMTRILKPRMVIPIHHDNFYPPISYWTPLDRLRAGAPELSPPVEFVELEPGVTRVFPL